MIPAFSTEDWSGRRLAVAMSGGVDSSVVAALAARSGAEVIGLTLKLYDTGGATARAGACCAGRDIRDARAVADRLGFAHYVFDHRNAFRESVVDDFVDGYAAGRTPLPCVRCNMGVKFTDLLRLSRELGAEALATGHYVRRIEGAGGPQLHRAIDPARDQSYFLFATTREQLGFLRFPLGDLPKMRVRAIAAELGLGVAAKPDSQDICFVPDGDYATLVKRLRPEADRSGDIVDEAGRVLGRHGGLVHFTIGQRRGLEIGGQAEPLYVVRLEPEPRPGCRRPPRVVGGGGAYGREGQLARRRPRRRGGGQGPLHGPRGPGATDGRSGDVREPRIRRRARAGGGGLSREESAGRRMDREHGGRPPASGRTGGRAPGGRSQSSRTVKANIERRDRKSDGPGEDRRWRGQGVGPDDIEPIWHKIVQMSRCGDDILPAVPGPG